MTKLFLTSFDENQRNWLIFIVANFFLLVPMVWMIFQMNSILTGKLQTRVADENEVRISQIQKQYERRVSPLNTKRQGKASEPQRERNAATYALKDKELTGL